ncbi:cupin domain-containing protein [bacterium]|nr:cupin domain-containing protein [bacterium]
MIIVRKENAPRYQRDNITSYLLLSESTTGAKKITTTLVEMEPGGKQMIHFHATEQCYMILDGEGEITVGEESKRVRVGDSIFIPSNSPHGLINTGDQVLRYLSAGSPVFGKRKESEYWPLLPEAQLSL